MQSHDGVVFLGGERIHCAGAGIKSSKGPGRLHGFGKRPGCVSYVYYRGASREAFLFFLGGGKGFEVVCRSEDVSWVR